MKQKNKSDDSHLNQSKEALNYGKEQINSTDAGFYSILEKTRKYFGRALFLSLILHSPLMVGTNKKSELRLPATQSLFGPKQGGLGIMGNQSNSLEQEELKKEITELEEKIEEMKKAQEKSKNPKQIDEVAETIAGLLTKHVQERINERKARINPEKVVQLRQKYKEMLETNQEIDYSEFVFEVEQIAMGLKAEEVQKAKKRYAQILKELQEIKPKTPNRSFLAKIVSITKTDPNSDDYELSITAVTDILNKGQGNCVAKAKLSAMLLQDLYPELWPNVKYQIITKHKRTILEIDEGGFLMEPAAPVLTNDIKEGSVIYPIKDEIEMFANNSLKTKKAISTKKSESYDDEKVKAADLKTDNTVFPEPKVEGKLKGSRNINDLIKTEHALPEHIAKELSRIKQMQKALNLKKAKLNGKTNLNDQDAELGGINVIKSTKGQVLEALAFKETNLNSAEINSRINGLTFMALDVVHNDPALINTRLTSLSAATIKKVSELNLDEIYLGNLQNFSSLAIEELFSGKTKTITLNLYNNSLPDSTRNNFLNSNSYKSTNQKLKISFIQKFYDDNCENTEKNNTPCLRADDLQVLAKGKGELELHYDYYKNLTAQELNNFKGSERSMIILSGKIIPDSYTELIKLKDNVPKIGLEVDTYYQMAFLDSRILDNPKIIPIYSYNKADNAYINIYHKINTATSSNEAEKFKKELQKLEKYIVNEGFSLDRFEKFQQKVESDWDENTLRPSLESFGFNLTTSVYKYLPNAEKLWEKDRMNFKNNMEKFILEDSTVEKFDTFLLVENEYGFKYKIFNDFRMEIVDVKLKDGVIKTKLPDGNKLQIIAAKDSVSFLTTVNDSVFESKIPLKYEHCKFQLPTKVSKEDSVFDNTDSKNRVYIQSGKINYFKNERVLLKFVIKQKSGKLKRLNFAIDL